MSKNKAVLITAAAAVGWLLYRHARKLWEDKQMQIDTIARTIWGEARGEGVLGMQAVADVIMNRYKAQSWYGSTFEEICKKPAQFSVWNKNDPNYAKMLAVGTEDSNFVYALGLAAQVYAGTLEDITGGATNYHAKSVSPGWAESMTEVADLGNHVFYA